jgi:DNA-binding LacI/PurR family transcriptional regulator
MPPAGKRPTLSDLAAAAGVSRATASNAFNRPERLSTARRADILALAERMGYAGPDPTAANLRRGRVGAIGVVIPDRLNYAFSDPAGVLILDGLAEAVGTAGSSLLLLAGDGTGGGPPAATVMSAAVDGFVLYCIAHDDPALAALQRRRLPMVLIDQAPLRGSSTVDLDEESGTVALVRHLLDLGHRRFGIVTLECRPDGRAGPIDAERRAAITYSVTRRRLDAAIDTLHAAGVDDVPMYEAGHNIPGEGEAAARWLVQQDPRPTAIVCQSDQLAIGVLATLREMGLDVPGDVSLAGFDDIEAARTTVPPLTTIGQPLRERGHLAGELLLKVLDGGRARNVRLPAELVVRGSTGRAPRSD